jgi:hypothetical protein
MSHGKATPHRPTRTHGREAPVCQDRATLCILSDG